MRAWLSKLQRTPGGYRAAALAHDNACLHHLFCQYEEVRREIGRFVIIMIVTGVVLNIPRQSRGL